MISCDFDNFMWIRFVGSWGKLQPATQYFTTQQSTTLHYTALHYTTQYCTTQHSTTLHSTTLHNTVPQYTVLHNTKKHKCPYTTLYNKAQQKTSQICSPLYYNLHYYTGRPKSNPWGWISVIFSQTLGHLYDGFSKFARELFLYFSKIGKIFYAFLWKFWKQILEWPRWRIFEKMTPSSQVVLTHLSKGQLSQETFVQGDKCPRESRPRRLWSEETFVQWSFYQDKHAQIVFSLFSIGYYNIDCLSNEKK